MTNKRWDSEQDATVDKADDRQEADSEKEATDEAEAAEAEGAEAIQVLY